MSQKRVLIIGAGIAGLCAGVYLRKNGFGTEILEMHTAAGGLATAWTRKGYTFENCVHWLVGSKSGADLNTTWKEVIDIDRVTFYDGKIFQEIEKGGRRLVVYKNVDRMEREFFEKAPEDAGAIKEFAGLVRKLSRFRMPGGDSFSSRLASSAKALPYLPALRKYSRLTMADYAKRFKNPLLRHFFGSGLGELSFVAMAFSLAWMSAGNAGYPIGGSPKLIGLIEESYAILGGKIRLGAKVNAITVENGRAAGVVLENGERLAADVVVSAADGHATIFKMLEGKYVDDRVQKVYTTYLPFPSYVQVSLGVAADLKHEPGFLDMALDREIKIDPQTRRSSLTLRIFHFDPTFAPPGKTAVVAFFPTSNDAYWLTLRDRYRSRYDEEKARIGREVVEAFENRFPAAKGRIEVVDVATPATVLRYTGNWHGSMEGWLMTPATGVRPLPAVLPGLKDFYMVGQWISPGGGLPSGLLTARAVSKRICRERGLPWSPK
jgi:phytoene dehydrogenase-like protein